MAVPLAFRKLFTKIEWSRMINDSRIAADQSNEDESESDISTKVYLHHQKVSKK